MKNTRGQFEILGLAVIGVVSLIILALFIFSSTVKYTVIGSALVVMSFIILLKADIKTNKVPVFLGVLAVGLVFIFASGMLQSIGGGERYVEVPFFATLECQRGLTSSFQATVPSSGDWFYKGRGLPDNTDSWNIMIKTPDYGLLGIGKRVEYYICDSRSFCSNRKVIDVNRRGDIVNIGNIDADKFVWVQHAEPSFISWKGISGATLEVTYQPFKLVRDDPLRGGRQDVANSVGCTVPTSDKAWTQRITSFSGSSNIDEFSGDNKLEVGEVINYISGDILAVNEGNTQSGGWCIYENGKANIYEIEKITYGSGNNINRVNLDNKIKTEECCDGETYPNNKICQNGKFIKIEEAECSSRRDCGTLEFFPTSSNTIGRYDCISGSCEIVDEKQAECTSNQQCKTNEICSRNTFTCELSSEIGGEGGDTQDTCTSTADCINGEICLSGVCSNETELKCSIFEKKILVTEKKCGLGCWSAKIGTFGIVDLTKESQYEDCVTADWVNTTLIVLVIGGLGAYALYLTTKKRKKRR